MQNRYTPYMRFNQDGRRLCKAENDTCPNLAGYKETTKGNKKRYHSKCDRHRRAKHNTAKLNKDIPLIKCEVCPETNDLHRHRIKRGYEYRPKNVVVLCKSHHQLFHKFEGMLAKKQHTIKRNYVLK